MGSMELGSVPEATEEPEVLDEHPVGQAEHDQATSAGKDDPAPAGHQQSADGRQRTRRRRG